MAQSLAVAVDSTDAIGEMKGEPVFVNTQTPSACLQLDSYSNKHPRLGLCVIVNNKTFNKQLTGQSNRDGTDVDAKALENVFMHLGFDVRRYNDLSRTDMSINLREVSEEDHSDADCFVCVILSHGEEGVVYGTDGKVPLEKLLGYFKGDICPSLAGKPKLFFIQACRGRRYDFGTVLGEDEVDALPLANTRKIPTEADFLIAYSVVPGHFSWRNNVDGSWFVQALCQVFEQHGRSVELLQMMTLVNKIVAYDFESCTDEEFTSHMKQVPCIVSMLTRQFFFKPK